MVDELQVQACIWKVTLMIDWKIDFKYLVHPSVSEPSKYSCCTDDLCLKHWFIPKHQLPSAFTYVMLVFTPVQNRPGLGYKSSGKRLRETLESLQPIDPHTNFVHPNVHNRQILQYFFQMMLSRISVLYLGLNTHMLGGGTLPEQGYPKTKTR